MLINFSYIIISTAIIILIVIFWLLFYYKSKTKIIYCSIIDTPHPDTLTNDIINAFYYSNMQGKNIKIYLFVDQISILFDQQNIKIKSVFNSSLIKFLMNSTYNYFIFFISKEGILEIIYFDNNVIVYNAHDENILLTINHSKENNLFDIQQGKIILKNNNAQKTIYIIKEILKKNIKINAMIK